MWTPFATVKFPKPEQGFMAIQHLREYRKLRDHCWDWKPTSEEIAHAKHELAETGRAPKFELNLPTKRERQLLLMDQRAYSVADLADILEKQEKRVAKVAAAEKKDAEEEQAAEDAKWQKVLDLAAEANSGGINKVEAHIKKLEARIEASVVDRTKAKSKSGIMVLRMKRNELVRAKEAADFVSGETDVPVERRKRWNQALQAIVEQRTTKSVIPLTPEEEAAVALAREESEREASNSTGIDIDGTTPALTPNREPKEWQPIKNQYGQVTNKPQWRTSTHPPRQRGFIQKEDRTVHDERPEMPSDAILIQWSNLQDAEWAAQWPNSVWHEWMGVGLRHAARQAGKIPQKEVRYEGHGDITAAEIQVAEEAKIEKEKEESQMAEEYKRRKENQRRKHMGLAPLDDAGNEKQGVLARVKGLIPGFGRKTGGEART
jgi:hypothetical protein